MSDNIPGAQPMSAQADSRTVMRERLCALVDGELETQDVADTIAACELKDWATYQLIGDVMRRADNIAPVSSTFAARMSAALEREQAHHPQAQTARASGSAELSSQTAGWRRWFSWPSVAMAAAVASVVWVAQPLFGPAEVTTVALSTRSAPAPAPAPEAAAVLAQALNDSAYRDYTEAHRQLAGPIAVQQAPYVPRGAQ